jgi:hypothetical protein
MPVNTPFALGALGFALPLLIALVVIVLVLKGYALWHAARASQKGWFIALLILNTAGILEVVYLLFFRPGAPYAHIVDAKRHPPHNHPHHHSSSDSSSAAE